MYSADKKTYKNSRPRESVTNIHLTHKFGSAHLVQIVSPTITAVVDFIKEPILIF